MAVWSRKRIAFLVIAAMAAAIVAGGYVFNRIRAGNPFIHAMTGGDLSVVGGRVIVPMGDVRLSIPREYFFSLPSKEQCNPGKMVMGMLLLTFLPNFDSIAVPKNRAEFGKGRGQGSSVLIGLQYGGCAPTGADYAKIVRRYSPGEITDSDFGYKRFGEDKYKNIPGREYLFKGSIESPVGFTECDLVIDGFSPGCGRYRLIGNNIVMHYSLSRRYLPTIDTIEAEIVAFLNTFRISGPTLEVIQ